VVILGLPSFTSPPSALGRRRGGPLLTADRPSPKGTSNSSQHHGRRSSRLSLAPPGRGRTTGTTHSRQCSSAAGRFKSRTGSGDGGERGCAAHCLTSAPLKITICSRRTMLFCPGCVRHRPLARASGPFRLATSTRRRPLRHRGIYPRRRSEPKGTGRRSLPPDCPK
jgi:hypothetical protein